MSHDPLCPDGLSIEHCCDVVAEIREDERSRVVVEFMSNHGDREIYAVALRDAVEAVKDVLKTAILEGSPNAKDVGYQYALGSAVIAIEALGGER